MPTRRGWLGGALGALALPARADPLTAAPPAPLDRVLQRPLPAPRLAWRPDARWHAKALSRARALVLGSTPAPEALPEVAWGARESRDGYSAQALSLTGALGDPQPGLLLRPDTPGPHPAMLLLHDHGARFDIGHEKLIRSRANAPAGVQASAQAWVQRFYGGQFVGDTLARAGFVVLALDALGWGGRSRPGLARDDQQALANHLMQQGTHWAGVIAADDQQAHRWLAAQPSVQPDRVAVLGFSMGAQRAWQLAALRHEVWACVAAHWMCTREGLLRTGQHTLQGQSAFSMLHPGLAAELEHPDLAALIAPRPLLLLGSPEDSLFPWDAVQAAWQQLGRAWPSGAPLRLQSVGGGHRFDGPQQQLALAWLQGLG